jgi:hypothetical protein
MSICPELCMTKGTVVSTWYQYTTVTKLNDWKDTFYSIFYKLHDVGLEFYTTGNQGDIVLEIQCPSQIQSFPV